MIVTVFLLSFGGSYLGRHELPVLGEFMKGVAFPVSLVMIVGTRPDPAGCCGPECRSLTAGGYSEQPGERSFRARHFRGTTIPAVIWTPYLVSKPFSITPGPTIAKKSILSLTA